jgi:hypothetical protein
MLSFSFQQTKMENNNYIIWVQCMNRIYVLYTHGSTRLENKDVQLFLLTLQFPRKFTTVFHFLFLFLDKCSLFYDQDEKNQILTTNCWLTQIWTDHHLKWNASDFAGIKVIRVPYQRVWRPDTVLYNKWVHTLRYPPHWAKHGVAHT